MGTLRGSSEIVQSLLITGAIVLWVVAAVWAFFEVTKHSEEVQDAPDE